MLFVDPCRTGMAVKAARNHDGGTTTTFRSYTPLWRQFDTPHPSRRAVSHAPLGPTAMAARVPACDCGSHTALILRASRLPEWYASAVPRSSLRHSPRGRTRVLKSMEWRASWPIYPPDPLPPSSSSIHPSPPIPTMKLGQSPQSLQKAASAVLQLSSILSQSVQHATQQLSSLSSMLSSNNNGLQGLLASNVIQQQADESGTYADLVNRSRVIHVSRGTSIVWNDCH